MNVKKNDTVIVLSGKDKGKKGKVLEAMPAAGKVVVEGVNVATCHVKPKKQGDQGGIINREIPSVRFQGHARLPEVRQGYPPCCQARRRQEGPRLQEVRPDDLRGRIETWPD